MKVSMKIKVISAVAVMLVMTMGISIFSQLSLQEVKVTTVEVKEGSASRIPKIQELNTQYIETQTNLLSFLMEKDDEKKLEYKEAQRELFTSLSSSVASYLETETDEAEREKLEMLLELSDSYGFYFECYLKGNVRVESVTEAGQKVGMILNDMIAEKVQSSSEQQNLLIGTADHALKTISMTNIIAIVIALLLAVYLIMIVVVPIGKIKRQLGTIIYQINHNQFDIDSRVQIKSKDELGKMVNDINTLIEKMGQMILLIGEDSQKLIGSVQVVSGKISSTNTSVSDTSAAMQELAASMEEITATTNELTSNSEHIYTEMIKIADNAKQGSEYAAKLREEARLSKKSATESKNETKEVMDKIHEALVHSIQNSRQVDKIDELTEEILSISAQTNLLALNASIEAARAGEAGKGFSVVADEIRELADSSKDTANTIQEISKLVRKAVHTLANDSKKMVAFIEETVLKDYDKFVVIAENYDNGVNNFDQMLHEFASMSKQLQQTIQTVDSSIQMVASTIEESTRAINSVAENATDMVAAMEGVTGEMRVSEEVSQTLLNEVNKYIKRA